MIVPLRYASAVEPWCVSWREVLEPKYPWRDQTSQSCYRSVPIKIRLNIHRAKFGQMSMISLRYQVSDLISQDITTVDTDNYEFGYGNEQNARRSSDGSLTLPSILISVRKIKNGIMILSFLPPDRPIVYQLGLQKLIA